MDKSWQLRSAQVITYGLLAALLTSFTVWQLTRPGGISILFWCVQCIPLLILVPGVIAQRPRAYIWLCFLMLAYFVKGVDGWVSPSRAWVDIIMLFASILLFTSSMLTGRWLHQYLYQS